MSLALLLLAAVPLELPQLPAGECFSARFTQTRSMPALQRPLVLQGRLRIERSGALEWEIVAPYRYRFSVRGDDITETTPDGATRVVDPAQAPWLRALRELFIGLLAGNAEALERWFSVDAVENTAAGRQATLTPANDVVAQVMRGMTLRYDAHLRGVRIEEGGGGLTEFHFDPLAACPARTEP